MAAEPDWVEEATLKLVESLEPTSPVLFDVLARAVYSASAGHRLDPEMEGDHDPDKVPTRLALLALRDILAKGGPEAVATRKYLKEDL